MTNEEKYKTPEERAKAFDKYCGNHELCVDDCLSGRTHACNVCHFKWLALDVEEEKPMPCPFCGGETVKARKLGGVVVECRCGYHTMVCDTTEMAIAAHNRVCRACKAYNGSEVTK